MIGTRVVVLLDVDCILLGMDGGLGDPNQQWLGFFYVWNNVMVKYYEYLRKFAFYK
jgi:hypothetical protein